MSSERRERFLKLERARPDGPDSADPLPGDARFESIGADPPGAPGPAGTPVPSTSTDRFRPPAERGLDTAEQRSGQPFTRCADCQVDNTVYAVRCQHCGADLDTPVQRAFNERLWADRQAQAEAEAREIAGRERARQAEAAEIARQKREIGEELARRERRRVDDLFPDGPLGGGGAGRRDTPGMRLLRLLPGTGWRIAAAVAVFGIPLLLLLFSRGLPQLVGMMVLAAVVGLFSPRSGRNRRW